MYIRNRTTTKILRDKTQFEMWNGYKPAVGHLKIFGVKAHALDKTSSRKFSSKGSEYVMVGYSDESKAYRLYSPTTRKIIVARDVKFFEEMFCGCDSNDGGNDVFISHHDESVPKEQSTVAENSQDEVSGQNTSNKNETLTTEQPSIENEGAQQGVAGEQVVQIGPGRPRIIRDGSRGRPRKLFNELRGMGKLKLETPENVEDALNGPYADEWLKSMETEYDSLIKNDTWELVDFPTGSERV